MAQNIRDVTISYSRYFGQQLKVVNKTKLIHIRNNFSNIISKFTIIITIIIAITLWYYFLVRKVGSKSKKNEQIQYQKVSQSNKIIPKQKSKKYKDKDKDRNQETKIIVFSNNNNYYYEIIDLVI